MSNEEENIKVQKEPKDIVKQLANVAFQVRKITNWLEEKMGADLDGNGRIGGGPYKKALVFLLAFGFAFSCLATSTNIAVWYGTESSPITYIDGSGNVVAPGITVDNLTIDTNVTVTGDATVGGNLTVTGTVTGQNVTARNGLTVNTNATVGGTLGVTGVATFTAESVHNGGIDADYITVDANAGIDAKSAGSLAIGTNTATSVNYGGASVTAHTFVTDGTGTGEIVLPDQSIGDAEIAAMAATKLTGNIAEARLTNAAATLGDDIGGNIVQASLTNAMPTMPALALNDGTAVTGVTALAMAASGLTGNISEDRLTNAAGTLGDNIGGNIPKASITNALETAGNTIGGNIPEAAITNALTTAVIPINGITNALATGTYSVPSARIDSGDIASDRMTVNAVVVSDFGAANQVLVGTGAGTFSAVTGSATITITNSSTLMTNIMYFGSGGVLLSNVYTGP